MTERRFKEYDNPALMKGRFESRFPLLYPGDIVKVSSRWAGESENPNKGKIGYIQAITHDFQSSFNRDYLIVSLVGGDELFDNKLFGTWLYTLDFVQRDKSSSYSDVLKKFECPLYIDDRVQIETGEKKGRIGVISSMQLSGSNQLELKIKDEEIAREITRLQLKSLKQIAEDYKKRDTPERYSEFLFEMQQNPELYALLKEKELFQEVYRLELIEDIESENSINSTINERKLQALNDASIIISTTKDVILIERFPPNNLFIVE